MNGVKGMPVRIVFLFCFINFGYINICWATPQMPNSLFFEGKEYPIDNDPMWDYFEKHPEKKPDPPSRMSALWRGYLAFFELRNKDLYLKDLRLKTALRRWVIWGTSDGNPS
jgi:hypothetical protein